MSSSSNNNEYNTKHIVPVHSYYVNLSREIDDADWIGEEDTAEYLRTELANVKEAMDNGDVWYPMF